MNVFPLKEKMVKHKWCTVRHSQISLFKHLQIICCRKHIPTTPFTELHNNPLLAWMPYLLELMRFQLVSLMPRRSNRSSNREASRLLHFQINQTPWPDITCRPSWPSPAGIFQYSHCQTAQSKCSSERSWLLTQNGLKWPSVLAGLLFALENRSWGKKQN